MKNQTTQTLDPNKLEELAGHFINEIGAAANAAIVQVGYDLGIFEALVESGPATASSLAKAIDGNERHLLEWLSSQYTSGFIDYDPETDCFSLSAEQQMVLTNKESPVYMGGSWASIASILHRIEVITGSIKTGDGVAWGDQCHCLFCSSAEFYRPAYEHALLSEWLPALRGISDNLTAGAKALDIGCGFGHSTAIMAKAFPKSQFTGIDLHEVSIGEAGKIAASSGLTNVQFAIEDARRYTGSEYDLVTIFDALHDMGNPVEILRNIRTELLTEDGTLMVVEPMAGDRLEENKNPMGRTFYAFSTAFCTANALSQLDEKTSPTPLNALGAQAGYGRLEAVLNEAGFSNVRQASAGDELMVIEASA